MAYLTIPLFLSSPYQLILLFIASSALYYVTLDSLWSLPILITHKQTDFFIFINLALLLVYCSLIWWLSIVAMRFLLRKVLAYTGWIFDNPKSPTLKTKIWRVCTNVFFKANHRKLFDFQDILPNLPLPKLDVTVAKYLKSVKPLFSAELYNKHETLAREFLQNEGVELQNALVKRHKITDNYVSQFWEENAYLAGGRRTKNPNEDSSPNPGLMVNISVALFCPFGTPINYRQASRAASLAHLQLHYRVLIQSEKFQPFHLQGVPLCSGQYRRLFNLTRTPGHGLDDLMFSPGKETSYIVVYNEGRYYKVDAYQDGKFVTPKQLEKTFLSILADHSAVSAAELKLPAFTAGDREEWAEFRENHLSKGQNKDNLRIIETCAFFVVFDPDERFQGELPDYLVDPDVIPYPKSDRDHLSEYAASILHGSGSNRWMDKTINMVVFKTGLFGYSVEHTTSDAPPYVQVVECVNAIDMNYFVGRDPKKTHIPIWIDKSLIDWNKPRYNAEGFINDDSDPKPAVCTKLEWKFSEEISDKIISQAAMTHGYAQSVQLKLSLFNGFGNSRIKQLKMSPDAFMQMAIQLAYYKDQNEFALTYESGLTRLFKWGRTETIRSLTEESCEFVRAMVADKIDAYKAYKLLQAAGNVHSLSTKQALAGQGIDRHLFALYVTGKLKGIDSEFLGNALSVPFKISTSQVPTNQSAFDLRTRPDTLTIGGGFGPVTKHGYGVAYFFQFDRAIAIHLSAYNQSPRTDAVRFYSRLVESLFQLETICSLAMKLKGSDCSEGENRFISYKDSVAN